MNKFCTASLLLLSLTVAPIQNVYAGDLIPSLGGAGHTPNSFADLAESLLPSVVNISSTQKVDLPKDMQEMPHFPPGSPFEDFLDEFMKNNGEGGVPFAPPASLGSGFVLDAKNGYIITNNHVVKDADEVRVTFHDDSTVEAQIIGRDEKIDLAVLKIDPKGHKLKDVKFGNSDKMRVGDWIIAIGNPFGLGGSVTAGIVSAQQRDIQAGPYDDFIQTDASINRGNSGGPMFNLQGEVIGINTAIFSPSGGSVGIGFAIPSNLAKPVIEQLVNFGHTRRGWLGLRIQTVTPEIAESLGLPAGSQGALVASITKTGPAEKAGLQSGDVILDFDGKPINAMRQLPRAVAETPIGKKTDMGFWRDGKKMTTTVVVGELEKAEKDGLVASEEKKEAKSSGQGTSIDSIGVSLSTITPQDREDYSIPEDVEGVLVTDVAAGSEAAEKGLSVGDAVVEVNQQPVKDPSDVSKAVDRARKSDRSSVLLLVNRGGDVRFVALRLSKK